MAMGTWEFLDIHKYFSKVLSVFSIMADYFIMAVR